MMAAITAAGYDRQVLLLEQNEKLGKKIYITGKGRGNVTNQADISDFFEKITSNPKFLYSALYGFTNEMLLDFLSTYGFAWKTERGGRVFPTSDHASDITKALEKALYHEKVEICLRTKVNSILTSKEAPDHVCGVQLDTGEVITAEHVIVATGGKSYPTTGSTGDGLRFANELGIETTQTYPSLVPFETKENDVLTLQGLALRNIRLEIRKSDRPVYEGFGELLFTHFGVSGPLVLQASSKLTQFLAEGIPLDANIDLKPAISNKQLDEKLVKLIGQFRQKQFAHFFDPLIPGKMRQVLVERSMVPREQKIADLTREQRRKIGNLLKHFSFTIIGTRGFPEAIITKGGVSVKELDPVTMRAKRIKGISFAGEVIDVDALTGGYNMQIAFSTGYAAGNAFSH